MAHRAGLRTCRAGARARTQSQSRRDREPRASSWPPRPGRRPRVTAGGRAPEWTPSAGAAHYEAPAGRTRLPPARRRPRAFIGRAPPASPGPPPRFPRRPGAPGAPSAASAWHSGAPGAGASYCRPARAPLPPTRVGAHLPAPPFPHRPPRAAAPRVAGATLALLPPPGSAAPPEDRPPRRSQAPGPRGRLQPRGRANPALSTLPARDLSHQAEEVGSGGERAQPMARGWARVRDWVQRRRVGGGH